MSARTHRDVNFGTATSGIVHGAILACALVAMAVFVSLPGPARETLAASGRGAGDSELPGRCCGPNSVYVLLRMHGIACKRSDVIARCNPNEHGCSVAALQTCSEAFGLRLRGVTVKREDLSSVHLPAIAHVGEPSAGHYLVLLSVDNSAYACVDGTTGLYYSQVGLGDFLRQWAGVLLVPEYVYKRGVFAGSLDWLAACLSVVNVVVWTAFVWQRWIGRRLISKGRPQLRGGGK